MVLLYLINYVISHSSSSEGSLDIPNMVWRNIK